MSWDRRNAYLAVVLGAVLWGLLRQGAFFSTDRQIFLALAVAALLLTPRWWAVVRTTQFVMPAGAIALAVTASSWAHRVPSAAAVALAPALAAVALGAAGVRAHGAGNAARLLGAVADLTAVAGFLGWAGVAGHLPGLAQLQTSGWRATATLGYANALGLVLLIGLLVAAGHAARFPGRAGLVRCWVLATGLLATQSRAAVAAAVLGWLLLRLHDRAAATVLTRAAGWTAVAFAGLLPAVVLPHAARVAALAPAVVGAAVGLGGLLAAPRGRAFRAVTSAALAGATIGAVVALHGRVLDGGSVAGRLLLWRSTLAEARAGGFFGVGPGRLLALVHGETGAVLAHSDPLQYLLFYGVPGGLALLISAWSAVRHLCRTRATAGDGWAVGAAVAAATAMAAAVDFPLHIPVIPALAALVAGVCAGSVTTKADSVTTKADSVTTEAGCATTKAESVPTEAGSVTTKAGSVTTKAGSIATEAGSDPTKGSPTCPSNAFSVTVPGTAAPSEVPAHARSSSALPRP
ncbi:hypothetical protein ACPPVO_10530 [Dactylosporangium sp. McL0621]|uniref:hypothetical protein n=1 Tax=Dactylosporangium sp. McL0621 TaxID=3415678 RepID=UPI003CFB8A50